MKVNCTRTIVIYNARKMPDSIILDTTFLQSNVRIFRSMRRVLQSLLGVIYKIKQLFLWRSFLSIRLSVMLLQHGWTDFVFVF
jgi:hypothetical protein